MRQKVHALRVRNDLAVRIDKRPDPVLLAFIGDRRRNGNVPQTVEGWDGGCGIDYATLRSWS
ncbi:hypothetical protein, partial [Burkholderia contaminans]|uniref:hypothetical protein n=1 Tax=Burkholderia contaminans TaxID=488447 RepID=UPI001E59B758